MFMFLLLSSWILGSFKANSRPLSATLSHCMPPWIGLKLSPVSARKWVFVSSVVPENGERKKHIKKKTRKQNFHGIVPGFLGEFCLCVFLPHKE